MIKNNKMIFRFTLFLSSLARIADLQKCQFLNDEPCMVRHTIIDMNSVELQYYPFIISLNKCAEICSVLSPKMCPKRNNRQIC